MIARGAVATVLGASLLAMAAGSGPAVADPTSGPGGSAPAAPAASGSPVTGPSRTVAAAAVPAADVGDHTDVARRLLVRWAPGAGHATRQSVLQDAGIPAPTRVSRLDARTDVIHLGTWAPTEVADLAERLTTSAAVDVAEPDRHIEVETAVTAPGDRGGLTLAAEDGTETSPTDDDAGTAPDDPLFGQQWGLHNTGQLVDDGPDTAVPGIDVRALAAWQVSRGHPDVRVAVIDTMIDIDHPDLFGAIVAEAQTIGGGTAMLPDVHGTAVAGTIGARADDGFGSAGVAPQAGIISIAAFESISSGTGTTTLSAIVAALDAAVTEGADVVNASWTSPEDSSLLRDAVASVGVPVVAAAGNEGRTLSEGDGVYPASFHLPNLVSVTAIASSGEVPDFSNRGVETVDVGAPGVNVLVPSVDGQHSIGSGTSFAAPHVSGAIALAKAAAPYATTSELVDAVSWTSAVLPGLVGQTRSGGMLDADALVRGVQRPICRPDQLEQTDFPDVGADNVHRAGIDCAAQQGVATGRADGTYLPAAAVTRAQLASFLARLVETIAELPEPPPAGFPDVAPGDVHAAAIDRLASLGIVHAGADGYFRPDVPVTRGQAAALLTRTYTLLSADAAPPSRIWYPDAAESTHADNIHRARDLGIVAGVTRTRFDADATLRRDQMASVMARAMDALGRQGVLGD